MSAVSILLLALLSAIGSAKAVQKGAVLNVGVGQKVAVESPDYPNVPPAGTKIIWYVTGEMNSHILLTCEDLRISPSEDCKNGYFMVYDGEKEEKYCGSQYGLTIRSVQYQMKIEFDVNWASGVAKCLVEGVGLNVVTKDESTKPGTDEPGGGSGEPGGGTGEPGGGSGEPGGGTGEPGGGTGEPGGGSGEPGGGTGEPGGGTGEPGGGTGEPGGGSGEPGGGTDEPGTIDPGEVLIKLKLGGPAYDEIIMRDVGSNKHFKWKFVTTPNAKITFFCRQLILGGSCSEGKLTTTGGEYATTYCRAAYNMLLDVSKKNTLGVEIKTYGLQQHRQLDCLAQAVPRRANVDHSRPHHFQHLKSKEVGDDDSDSRSKSNSKEHGKLTKTTCKCGYSKKNRRRIVNGEDVNKGEFPWVVALVDNGGQFCGGSIITEHHVLTAAHCTVGRQASQTAVLVGTTDVRKIKNGQAYEVKEIIEHNYDRSKFHLNDVSILYLKKKIKFSDEVGPVCLSPKQIPLTDKSVTVMGWGSLGPIFGWNVPPKMMKVKQRIVDFNTCAFLWYRQFTSKRQDRVCTWAHAKTACFGDSGGPLVWLDPETRRYTQVGVVSFGQGCKTDIPSVYSDVSFFYDWILKVIADTKKAKTCVKKEKK